MCKVIFKKWRITEIHAINLDFNTMIREPEKDDACKYLEISEEDGIEQHK